MAIPSRSLRDHASRYDVQFDSIDLSILESPLAVLSGLAARDVTSAAPTTARTERRFRREVLRNPADWISVVSVVRQRKYGQKGYYRLSAFDFARRISISGAF
jgi:hypothetical protein